MLKVINDFPNQFVDQHKLNISSGILEKISNRYKEIKFIHVFGQGGSALPASLLNDFVEIFPKIQIHRSYDIPKYLDNNHLIIISSFSGNTEEAISNYNFALKKNLPILVITNGGKLAELAKENDNFYIKIKDCAQPRMAAAYNLTIQLDVMHALGLIEDFSHKYSKWKIFLENNKAKVEKQGKELANISNNLVPIFYGTDKSIGTTMFCKIKINENSKTQAFYNVFPELNHNEMVGWTRKNMDPVIIYLSSQNNNDRIITRRKVMKKLLNEKGYIIKEILAPINSTHTESLWYFQWVVDFMSYHLAIDNNIDPIPVEMVEKFKKLI